MLALLETVLRENGETQEADAVRARLEQRTGAAAPGEGEPSPPEDQPPR